MSVGFIGAGQLAHALVKGFTAAGEATFFVVQPLAWTESKVTDVTSYITDFGLDKDKNAVKALYIGTFLPRKACTLHSKRHYYVTVVFTMHKSHVLAVVFIFY